MGFEVQAKPCSTCIYEPASGVDVGKLEAEIADEHGLFKDFRVCHQSKTACCRVFWDRHKDDFALGQIAQSLNFVSFVEHHDGPSSG